MREGKKRDFCSLLRLVMELIKQALQSFNSTKPARDNGMRGEAGGAGRKRKKESALIIRSPPSWKEWSWGQGDGMQFATGSSTQ